MSQMHPSILTEDNSLERTALSSTKLGCPLCPRFMTRTDSVIQRHLRNHTVNAVHFQEKIICRCNLPCRDRSHFHCPFCATTIIQKHALAVHLTECHKKSDVVQHALVPPCTPSSPETHLTSEDLQEDCTASSNSPPPSGSALIPDHSYSLTASPKTPTGSGLPSSHVECPLCSVVLYKQNLLLHMQRKHGQPEDVTAQSHLKGPCVDGSKGETASGFSAPSHEQRRTCGQQHVPERELEEGQQFGLLSHSIRHHVGLEVVQDYCSTTATEEPRQLQVLQEMLDSLFFGDSEVDLCKKRQQEAEEARVPLSVVSGIMEKASIAEGQKTMNLDPGQPVIERFVSPQSSNTDQAPTQTETVDSTPQTGNRTVPDPSVIQFVQKHLELKKGDLNLCTSGSEQPEHLTPPAPLLVRGESSHIKLQNQTPASPSAPRTFKVLVNTSSQTLRGPPWSWDKMSRLEEDALILCNGKVFKKNSPTLKTMQSRSSSTATKTYKFIKTGASHPQRPEAGTPSREPVYRLMIPRGSHEVIDLRDEDGHGDGNHRAASQLLYPNEDNVLFMLYTQSASEPETEGGSTGTGLRTSESEDVSDSRGSTGSAVEKDDWSEESSIDDTPSSWLEPEPLPKSDSLLRRQFGISADVRIRLQKAEAGWCPAELQYDESRTLSRIPDPLSPLGRDGFGGSISVKLEEDLSADFESTASQSLSTPLRCSLDGYMEPIEDDDSPDTTENHTTAGTHVGNQRLGRTRKRTTCPCCLSGSPIKTVRSSLRTTPTAEQMRGKGARKTARKSVRASKKISCQRAKRKGPDAPGGDGYPAPVIVREVMYNQEIRRLQQLLREKEEAIKQMEETVARMTNNKQ